jgi:multidrug efflux pump subunit AcrA (membrane-fusion protein)
VEVDMPKRNTLIWLLILTVFVAGCQGAAQPTETPRPQSSYTPVVSVTGELVPATWATLSAEAGGEVAEVLVEPGDLVSVGSPLVLLDTADLELALASAEQEVAAQEALLAQLLSGATEEVIARADRDNAYQIEQAEIALGVKRQQLAQAQARDPADDVAAAQARIKQIQAQLAQVRAQDPSPEVEMAQVEVERAKIALDDTRDEYNKALDRPWEPQSVRDGWAKQLDQATLNYRAAQAQLDAANNAKRAHTLSIDVLEAQLEEAQTLLAQAQDAQAAYQIALDILGADVEAAEAQLEYLRGWDNPYRDQATEQEIAQVQARLQQAGVAVQQIEAHLREATIVAPFGGTVGAVNVRVGEMVSPGQPLVTLGDLDTLRVETTDLDEIDVVRVSVDQEVAVTFDAFPDRVFEGRVTRISPMAESGSGGVHYTVVVELDEMDPTLRWGMTAFVDIETR